MSAYDAQRALAMVMRAKKKGRTAEITFTRTTEMYVPGTGVTATETQFTATAVVLPVNQAALSAFDSGFENGTLIESKLRALLIPALGLEITPAPGDTVSFPDGTGGTLLGCTPLNPDVANPIIYQGTVKL